MKGDVKEKDAEVSGGSTDHDADASAPESSSTAPGVSEAPDASAKGGDADEAEPSRGRMRSRQALALIAAGVLAIVLFALAAFQYWGPGADNRDAETNQATAAQFAGDSAIKILSYKHGTVDQDVATATTLLTGDFLDYYKTFTSTVVIPAAKKEQVDTEATIAGSAVERATADNATVLVFVNQSTTTAANDTPTLSASSVRVVIKRVNGQLKVEKFDPV